jgi:hypothetical protein
MWWSVLTLNRDRRLALILNSMLKIRDLLWQDYLPFVKYVTPKNYEIMSTDRNHIHKWL